LRHLVELALLEHSGGAFVQFAICQITFGGANRFDQAVRQRAVVAAVDEGVRGGLRVSAAGQEHLWKLGHVMIGLPND